MKKLLLGLLVLLSYAKSYSKEGNCPEEIQVDNADNINKFASELLRYNERLLEVFQSVGHDVNKGNIKLTPDQKKRTTIWIQENQKNIITINQNIINNGSESLIAQYVIKTNSMVLSLNIALLSNFKNLIKTDIAIKRSPLLEPTSTQDLLLSTQNNIRSVSEKVDKLGYNKLNLAVRRFEEIDLNYGITSKVKSILLYSLITTITLRLIDKDRFPEKFYIKMGKELLDRKFFPSKSAKNIAANNQQANPQDPSVPVQPQDNDNKDNNNEKDTFTKSLLTAVISTVIVDAIKGDLAEFVKKIYYHLINETRSEIKETYGWLRGSPSAVSSSGYEYVSSSNTLEDSKLVGLEDQKHQLGQLVNSLKNLPLFEKAKISINKAYLITGPAGCGKSYLARAVCGSINKNLEDRGIPNKIGFKEVKFLDIWNKKDGISQMIKEAQSEAPCILFLDEIHLLKLQTEGDGKALTEFLTALSGINSENNGSKPVILIAATNRPDLLDPALLRSGRFESVKVERPSLNIRKEYFQIMLKDQGINTENFDIERLAQLTETCSYAQLDQVIKDARFKAKSQAKGISSTQDLEDSINTVVFKIKQEEILPISEESKKIIAAHLVGKSLLQILFDDKINKKLLKVTLKATIPGVKESAMLSFSSDKKRAVKERKTKYGHIFTYSKDEVANFEDEQNLELESKVLLSGKIAEQIILGTQHIVKKSDKTKALELAKKIIYNGIKPESLSKNLLKEYESRALSLLNKFEQETKIILEKNKEKLQKIYQDLLAKQTLSRSDMLNF